jgi:tetratricopeptide (TPR) repeat protein
MKINGGAILIALAAFGFLVGAVFLGMNRTRAEAALKPAAEGPPPHESADGERPPAPAPAVLPAAAAAMPSAFVEAERNLQLARVAEQGKDYDLAVSYLNEALRLRPDYRDALVARWDAHGAAQQWPEALADANAVLRLSSNDAELAQGYAARGFFQLGLKNYDAAIRDCCEALRLGRKTADVYSNRGLAYCIKHEREKAIADYSMAIQLDPNDGDIYTRRGQAYYQVDKFDGAFADSSRSIELKPNAVAYAVRGSCRYNWKQYASAIQDARSALALDPQYGVAYVVLAASYRGLGDGQNAAIYDAKFQELLTRQQLGK